MSGNGFGFACGSAVIGIACAEGACTMPRWTRVKVGVDVTVCNPNRGSGKTVGTFTRGSVGLCVFLSVFVRVFRFGAVLVRIG